MWLTHLYRRFRERIHEVGKFGIVGSVSYLVDTVLFVLLVLVMESLTAKTLATLVAATVAFVGNRFWTWRHRARSGLAREYGLYFALNGIGLAIALAFLGASHYGLGAIWPAFQTPIADVVAANVVGLGAGTSFRFWSYRRFVFRELSGGATGHGGEPATGPTEHDREPAGGPAAHGGELASVAEDDGHGDSAAAGPADRHTSSDGDRRGTRPAAPSSYDPSLAHATPGAGTRRGGVA